MVYFVFCVNLGTTPNINGPPASEEEVTNNRFAVGTRLAAQHLLRTYHQAFEHAATEASLQAPKQEAVQYFLSYLAFTYSPHDLCRQQGINRLEKFLKSPHHS